MDASICPNRGQKMATFRNRHGKWQARVQRKERIRAAHWKHGQETEEAKAERSAKSLMFNV